jgi:hypothetical protein
MRADQPTLHKCFLSQERDLETKLFFVEILKLENQENYFLLNKTF